MAEQQRRPMDAEARPSPTVQAEDTDLASTGARDSAADRCYDYGAMSDALSPVDEERQSRPTKQIIQAQNTCNTSESVTASASTGTNTAPLNTTGIMRVYHSPAMGTLTPPRSPQAGEVLYHNQQQAIHVPVDSGTITPPRSARRNKSRKSASKRSSSKKNNGNKHPDTGTSSAADNSTGGGGGGGGVASSIKKSLSNLSLFTSTDGDTGDEEAGGSNSGAIKSYHDDDLTSAHHRAELYGQIGGPTGLIGMYGERTGCKRMLVLITLAFILLSLVLQRISDGDDHNNGGSGFGIGGTGTKEGADITKPSSTEEEESFLNGEIGELTPGKCKRIIDMQTEDLDVAVSKNADLEKENKRLEIVVENLKSRLQAQEQKQQQENEKSNKRGHV